MSGDERARVIAEVLDEHATTNVTAGWPGSPDPHNPRNIRRVCRCGEVIGRLPYPKKGTFRLGGDDFDAPHREHIAAVLTAVAAALPTPAPEAGRCICDGAAYHTAERNASRHPFLVHPECPVHTPAPAGEDATLTQQDMNILFYATIPGKGGVTNESLRPFIETMIAEHIERDRAQRGAADQATLAAVRAEELRAVADYIEHTAHGVAGPRWLRDRADHIERTLDDTGAGGGS